MKEIKRIILSGGGTGGHIYPALALYRALKASYPDVECLYIGTERGLESTIVPRQGIPFQAIEISGIKRSLTLENLKVAWQMLTATRNAKKLIREFEPDLVLGTGGYVCGPVLLAASQLKIPTIIHEQNSVAGITNKFLARSVDRIATCFEEVKDDFGKFSDKVVLTGNPRGQEVLQTEASGSILSEQFDLDDQLATVLIFGGSRGAPAINQAGLEGLTHWQEQDYQIILATGQSHYDDLDKKLLERYNTSSNIRIVPYIENMPAVFQSIDLVMCRSGATTLTELTALGLPSILIPSPYVTNNHQEQNAMALVQRGAAEMIRESELNANLLIEKIEALIHDPASLERMRQQAQQMGITDASQRLIQMMEELIN
ncbi:undecaprenyldiphospho-muramoylpentapeptide beta-N-acetylglucosaminyltransferase [Facklamia sp. DSM 111018]|uniref:UDP-N-acetylglucosamine--N-acetylmuramyl-(pentapeptide) pyrophosphoryl-undecaprenol N-acetylglucosamine transferase n=1 Tax=Facklamia lactis TaxID=2749967 RepID=A0ABS0LNW3_9LACT|nr:undecaprenyldiphospho-muramoylpentapeptide beta-N-acetylglucosaminyltransferase [Facklamia lactis]MBG9979643.1 undecaprenyldiphospho-muramoylpentapeptide beta-N-acetylglucosaminyltransferase [Facklamia lactis]MBG9985677.1 undecaprenyldiphospho-muramoylpentapeptide beta-N-acetylglucosaminyltransferase [Facklamia lactis]